MGAGETSERPVWRCWVVSQHEGLTISSVFIGFHDCVTDFSVLEVLCRGDTKVHVR